MYKNPEDYFWQYDFLAVTTARKFSKNNINTYFLRSTLNNLNSIVTTEICCTVDDKTVVVPLHSSTSQQK